MKILIMDEKNMKKKIMKNTAQIVEKIYALYAWKRKPNIIIIREYTKGMKIMILYIQKILVKKKKKLN